MAETIDQGSDGRINLTPVLKVDHEEAIVKPNSIGERVLNDAVALDLEVSFCALGKILTS